MADGGGAPGAQARAVHLVGGKSAETRPTATASVVPTEGRGCQTPQVHPSGSGSCQPQHPRCERPTSSPGVVSALTPRIISGSCPHKDLVTEESKVEMRYGCLSAVQTGDHRDFRRFSLMILATKVFTWPWGSGLASVSRNSETALH